MAAPSGTDSSDVQTDYCNDFLQFNVRFQPQNPRNLMDSQYYFLKFVSNYYHDYSLTLQ